MELTGMEIQEGINLLNQRLDVYKKAKEHLNDLKEDTEANFVQSITLSNGRLEETDEILKTLEIIDRASERLNSLISSIAEEIKRQEHLKRTPENCFNYIYNGGDCEPKDHWSCRDGDCFVFIGDVVLPPHELVEGK